MIKINSSDRTINNFCLKINPIISIIDIKSMDMAMLSFDSLNSWNTLSESNSLKNSLLFSMNRKGKIWEYEDVTTKKTKLNNLPCYLNQHIKPLTEKQKEQKKHGQVRTKTEKRNELFHSDIESSLIGVKTDLGGNFINYYAPNIWYMCSNFKSDINTHLSDIVKGQYEIAASKGHFSNVLPSVICRRCVKNKIGETFINKYEDELEIGFFPKKESIINEFMQLNGNGKSTSYILKEFNLEVIDIHIDNVSIYLSVKPKNNESVLATF